MESTSYSHTDMYYITNLSLSGNICRSPIAEAVFNHVLKERSLANWEVDSGAIGSWHIGRNPDPRAISTMKKHNVHMSHKARQVAAHVQCCG